MKKLTLVIIFSFLIQFLGIGQNNTYPETSFGGKMGASLTSVGFEPSINQQSSLGFLTGFTFRHIEGKNVGIQIELNYIQAGWTEKLTGNQEYQQVLDYLQLPVLTHVYFGKKNTKFFLNVGPYVSYLINCREITKNIILDTAQSYYGKAIDNKLDYGMSIGGGLSQRTSIGTFSIEGSANFGFNDLYDTTEENQVTSSENLIIAFSLGYLIP